VSIPLVEIPPLSRSLPRIGFGCGRIVGRSTLRQSARLIEAALDAGIRYFDVAPYYGMGTAEEVLGEVIGNNKDVVIATKVGLPRPVYDARRNLVRKLAKPVLDRARGLKTLARRFYAPRQGPPGSMRPRYDYSEATIRAAIEESLRCLRRDRVDVYLAHDPHPDDLTPELASRFEALRREGRIGAFGAGVEEPEDRWKPFGGVWQSGWPGERAATYAADVFHVFHGVIRLAPKNRAGATTVPASQLIRRAMEVSPESMILISTSTPRRLRELVDGL
jgi:aryl-alcohol dehydrogenase-like predicted oxidoreductase